MTEAEWLASEDQKAMLAWLTSRSGPRGYYVRHNRGMPLGDRKLRLVAQNCLAMSGAIAWDGVTGEGYPDEYPAAFLTGLFSGGSNSEYAALLREIVGNPWRLQHRNPYDRQLFAGLYHVLTHSVVSLAQAAYDERQDDGTLDPEVLAVLSDALEEAGCVCGPLLAHLRGRERPPGCGVPAQDLECAVCDVRLYGRDVKDVCRRKPMHVRGCWALDLILGKE